MTPGEKVGASQHKVYSVLPLHVVLPVMMALATANDLQHAQSAGLEPGNAPEHHCCPPENTGIHGPEERRGTAGAEPPHRSGLHVDL